MKYCGAMLNFADLKRRCNVNQTTKCWQWVGACDSSGTPSVWSRAIQGRTSLGVFICLLTTGKRPEKGRRWYVVCDTKDCANPAHRKEGSVSEAMTHARSKYKRTFSMLARSRISVARRSRPTKLDETKAHDIRSSEEPQSVLAHRYGVAKSTISHIRSGRTWRPLIGNSVFTFRP